MARDLVSRVWVRNQEGSDFVAFDPGDKIPSWAKEQMGDHCFTDSADANEEEAGGEPVDYSKQKVDDLRAEIDRRNEGRAEEGQIVPDGDKKADLVAALEADDAASGA